MDKFYASAVKCTKADFIAFKNKMKNKCRGFLVIFYEEVKLVAEIFIPPTCLCSCFDRWILLFYILFCLLIYHY
jgi:hypothetical protein